MTDRQDVRPLLPLIRWISAEISPVLIRLPLTPNQITTVSLFCGLAAAFLAASGDHADGIGAAALFFVSYLLDHCDGEIARAKGLCSRFGEHYDTFVDWLVNAAFFLGLGIGAAHLMGEIWLFWCGLAAAVGASINYALGVYREAYLPRLPERKVRAASSTRPQGRTQTAIFVFRELARADFWLIVTVLALADQLWVLLPTGAIGAQVYWLMALAKGSRDYHV